MEPASEDGLAIQTGQQACLRLKYCHFCKSALFSTKSGDLQLLPWDMDDTHLDRKTIVNIVMQLSKRFAVCKAAFT